MANKHITLPPYIKHNKIGKNETVQLIAGDCQATISKVADDRIEAIDSKGNQVVICSKDAITETENEFVLSCDTEIGEELNSEKLDIHWVRHPDINMTPEQIVQTWYNGVSLRQEAEGHPGLRTPQLGAIHAALAHWTTSVGIATIVMPTGTGKTEAMLSLLIAAQCERLLVTVPSDSLRGQLAEKFETLGLLKKFRLVSPEAECPIVGILQEHFQNESDLRAFLAQCNVVITTMAYAAGYSEPMQNCFSDMFPYYFIDEAHHTTAKTWMKFIDRFSKSRVLQFTATPFRNDGAKLNGEIIYNYPLKKAQEEHYFTTISFDPIFEVEQNTADIAIAEEAIATLEKQQKAGYTRQIIMARCEIKNRAREVYKIYKTLCPQYNPVLIFSGTGLSQSARDEAIAHLKDGTSKVVVCVDMLGEGFDLPTLKIAALHDVKKSLTVTLQLIGRFTRTKFDEDLGNATFIANVADLFVSRELQRLYAQDADWNELLPEMSTDAINQEIDFAELIKGFRIPDDLKLPLQNLMPALSTVIYHNPQNTWHPDCFQKGIILKDGDRAWSIINQEENMLIIIIARRQPIDWGNIQEIENVIWDLLIVIKDDENKLIYINGSDNNGIYAALAEAIIGEKTSVIRHSDPFKAFYGINRIRLQNVGLKQIVGKNIRFRMSVGSDVAEALSLAEKSGGQKAFIVGVGYEGGRKVTLGCSYKGRIWTLLTGNLQSLQNWCTAIGTKVTNPGIDGDAILKETLVPKLVDKLPAKPAVWIDWNEDLYAMSERKIEFVQNGSKYNFSNTSIELDVEKSNENCIAFSLLFYSQDSGQTSNCELFLRLGISDGNAISMYSTQDSQAKVTVHIGRKEWVIEDFFQEYEPCLFFVDGSYLCGNEYIELKRAPGMYPRDRITSWDWSGVNLSNESQGIIGQLQTDSIQYHVVQELLKQDYDIIYDDDNSGEIADLITLKASDKSIDIGLYHLKFAIKGIISNRIDNLYEVCGQAQKSIHWKFKDSTELFSHLYRRQTKISNGQSGTRIIKGDIKILQHLDNLSRVKLPLQFHITIVQPGLSARKMTVDQQSLLSVTEQYLMDVANIHLNIIANK